KRENVSPAAPTLNLHFVRQVAQKCWCSLRVTAWKCMVRQKSACRRMKLLIACLRPARFVTPATVQGYRFTVTKLQSAYGICFGSLLDSIRWWWVKRKFLVKQKRLINQRALLVRLGPAFIGCFNGPFVWQNKSAHTQKSPAVRCRSVRSRSIWPRKFSANLAIAAFWFWGRVTRASARRALWFPEV